MMGTSVMGENERGPLHVSLYGRNALPETEFRIGKTVGILLTSAGIMWIRPSKMKGCDGECQREGCKCHRSLTEWCMLPLGHSELVVVLLDLKRSRNLSGNCGMRRGPKRYIAR